jgi:hypothetical protein
MPGDMVNTHFSICNIPTPICLSGEHICEFAKILGKKAHCQQVAKPPAVVGYFALTRFVKPHTFSEIPHVMGIRDGLA